MNTLIKVVVLFALLYLVHAGQARASLKNIGGYTIDTESLCGGYPKVALSTPEGTCVGLVASEENGLKRPRRILQLPDGDFIITDMRGWVDDKGYVWRFNPLTGKLSEIFSEVDHAHGLGLGPDGLVYVGTRKEIFRFDPENPKETKEYIIKDLPQEGLHALAHFIFNEEGDLIVNVGAPSDQCLDEKDRPQFPCPESTGAVPQANLRLYKRDHKGHYPAFTILAHGLRNSMALALEPQTGQLFQGENGMDFDDADSPEEEINLIREGAHYGWPYCYADAQLNRKYKRTFFNRRVPKIDCSDYESPVALLPAHAAPLDMLFYQGAMFPELDGKLIVSFHGYRETGHRIVSLETNENFLPQGNTRQELISNWTTESGLTPKGAPVGMTVAKDGSIWFVEDKNKTIMVFTKGEASTGGTAGNVAQIKLNDKQIAIFKELQSDIFEKSCQGCHNQFVGGANETVNSWIKEGYIKTGSSKDSPLYQRISGTEAGNQMPLGSEQIAPKHQEKLKMFIDSLK